MNRVYWIFGLILLLIVVAGCGLADFSAATITPPPPGLSAAGTATSLPAAATPTNPPSDTPTAKPTATRVPTLPPATFSPSADLMATIEAIEVEMEELRGMDRTLPITRSLMTREELTAYLEREFAEEYPPEEVEADVRVLAAFDFVSRDFDLQGLLLDLYSSQILGMYDDEEDTFYIITEIAGKAGDELGLLDRLTWAHEYVHGLQDQHFELETFTDDDLFSDDEALARMALVEGDASLAMTEYLFAHVFELTAEDIAALEGDDGQATEVLDAAPPIIRETFDFPYTYGLEFVTIVQDEGWEAVNEAFDDPPQSTEQILHPEKYLSRDEPTIVTLPPLTDTLGSGWHLVEVETLGEFQTNLYLAQQVDQATARLASEGWDGDRYAFYVKDDAEVLVFVLVWDSPTDREEFVAAYTQYAGGKYGQVASRSNESEIWWETPDQTARLAWEGNRVVLLLGPDPATVTNVLATLER
jgi:hypothetical protein